MRKIKIPGRERVCPVFHNPKLEIFSSFEFIGYINGSGPTPVFMSLKRFSTKPYLK
jgi:hypothetical protein